MSINLFTDGTISVQMESAHIRGYGERRQKRQTSGFDSDGQQYVYIKHALTDTSYTVVYARCSLAVRDSLLSFRGSVGGLAFTWNDHIGTPRTVRFAPGEIRTRQVTPNSHRIEIPLEEEQA